MLINKTWLLISFQDQAGDRFYVIRDKALTKKLHKDDAFLEQLSKCLSYFHRCINII